MHVLVWNGIEIDRKAPRLGGDIIQIHVINARTDEAQEKTLHVYTDQSLLSLRQDIAAVFQCDVASFALLKGDKKSLKNASIDALGARQNSMSLDVLGITLNARILLVEPPPPVTTGGGGGGGGAGAGASGSAGVGAGAGAGAGVSKPSAEVLRKIKDTVVLNIAYRDNKRLPQAMELSWDSARSVAECRVAVATALGCAPDGMRLAVHREGAREVLVDESIAVLAVPMGNGALVGLEAGSLPKTDEIFFFVRVVAKKGVYLVRAVNMLAVVILLLSF